MQKKRMIVLVGIIIFFAWICSHFFYQLMLIQGQSMEPSFHNLQFVWLNKYDHSYENGDVIAFRCDGISAVLVKRIVGKPGDIVSVEDGVLKVNGKTDAFFEDSYFEYSGILETAILLRANEYIVIGDNIPESKDSRYEYIGVISGNDIVGKVVSK